MTNLLIPVFLNYLFNSSASAQVILGDVYMSEVIFYFILLLIILMTLVFISILKWTVRLVLNLPKTVSELPDLIMAFLSKHSARFGKRLIRFVFRRAFFTLKFIGGSIPIEPLRRRLRYALLAALSVFKKRR